MGKSVVSFMLGLAVLTGTASHAFAQATATGTLLGTVSDKSGAVIPGADVKINSAATGLERTGTTGTAGFYRFDLLPSGKYEVRISAKGFQTAVFQNVELAVTQTSTVDVVLAISQQAEVVTVESSGAPILDTSKSDVSLPITHANGAGRSAERPRLRRTSRYLAPGAKPVDSYDPTKNRIGVFAVNGSQRAQREYHRKRHRQQRQHGRRTGDAVAVGSHPGVQHQYAALFGGQRAQRRRRDQRRHEVRNERPARLRLLLLPRSDLMTQNALETEKAPYKRQQFGGSIGGPIKKDGHSSSSQSNGRWRDTNITVDPNAFKELTLLGAARRAAGAGDPHALQGLAL